MSVARGQQNDEVMDGFKGQPRSEREIRAVAEMRIVMEKVCEGWRLEKIPALVMLADVLPTMLVSLVQGIGAEWEALSSGDGRTVSQAVQRALQGVGVSLLRGAWMLQGHATVPPVEQRPSCAECGARMKLVAAKRGRQLVGRFGRYTLERPYYTCPCCGGGCAPADAAWGIGSGLLDPDLMEVTAADGVRDSFEETRRNVWRHLQVTIDDNEAQRATEAMGMVLLRQAQERADAGIRVPPPDPGSDIVLLEVDGGRVEAGGEWREAKVAAAGPLGPNTQLDPATGRIHLCSGPLHYTASIASADEFFAREVRQVAEDAGLFHPRVRSVVLLSDGGEWIENRWASLGMPDHVNVFDILDIRHLEEHVWTAARKCWGDDSPRTKRWAIQQIEAVRSGGPEPLLTELARIRPRSLAGREELRKLRRYLKRNAHRLQYPHFVAQQLPIGSGAIEGAVRTVNNERAKQSGMHWSVLGACAVLALRAIALSPPSAWAAFWATRPQLARPTNVKLGGRKWGKTDAA